MSSRFHLISAVVVMGLFVAATFNPFFVMPFSIAILSYVGITLAVAIWMILRPVVAHPVKVANATGRAVRGNKRVTLALFGVAGLVAIGYFVFSHGVRLSNYNEAANVITLHPVMLLGLLIGGVGAIMACIIALKMDKS